MANVPTTLSALTAQNEITHANLWLNDLTKMRDNNDRAHEQEQQKTQLWCKNRSMVTPCSYKTRLPLFANRFCLFFWEAQEEPTWPVSEPACPVSLPNSLREKRKFPNLLKSISAEAKLLVHQKTANNQPQGHLPKVLHMDSELVAPKHPFVHRTFSHQMPSVLGLMSMLSINLIPYRIFHQSRTRVLSEMLFPVFLFLVRTYVWAVAWATL